MMKNLWRVSVAAMLLAFFSHNALAAERYKIDLSHSFVMFKISHLGFSIMNGRFNDFEGEFTYDPQNPSNSRISVTVKTASIDTNWAERDKHLRSADFLDVEKYPTATFTSTSYSENNGKGILKGNLTLHGVTRPVEIAVQQVGAGKDPWGGYRRGFTGSTRIKRSDFGISYNLGPSSEDMELHFVVEGIRQ
ncbi:MAG: YceI family protein [Gammaproteobacteria bacterium]